MLSLRHLQSSPYIYSISVDSRSKNSKQSLSDYTISLETVLNRVKTVQLGSIYLPKSRQAVTKTINSNVTYSEPITVPQNTTLVFQETTTVFDKSTCTTLSTTVHPAITIELPATLNPITSVDVPGVTTTTASPHGLSFALSQYASFGLKVGIVGGLYPATSLAPAIPFGPQVDATTVAAVPGDSTFDFVGGYLDTLALGCHDMRNVGAGYNSFLYSEPPTLSELLSMLNKYLVSILDPGNPSPTSTLLLRTHFIIDDTNNTISLLAPTHSFTAGNLVTTTTSQLLSTSTLSSILNLPNNTVDISTQKKMSDISSLPFVRYPTIPPGTYTHQELEALIATVLNPLDFTTTLPTDRTLNWVNVGGVPQMLVIPQGRYSGAQLANVLTDLMVAATGSSYYNVVYVSDPVTGEGRFTFSHAQSLLTGLDFTGATNANTAALLGFDPIAYSGSSMYTSPHVAVTGVSPGQEFPLSAFHLAGVSTSQHFTLSTVPEQTVFSNNMLVPPLEWITLDSSGLLGIVPGGYQAGQVLQIALSGPGPFPTGLAAGDVLTVVLEAPWDGTGGIPFATMKPTASILGVTTCAIEGLGIGTNAGPSPTVNVQITPLKRNVFQPHLSAPGAAAALLGFPPQTLPVLPSVEQIVCVDAAVGNSTFYAPTGTTGAATSYAAPFCWKLGPPDYVLMRLAGECEETTSNEHSYQGNRFMILAKLYTNPFFRHISEEMLHASFPSMRRITKLRVQFLNPDGSFVDWNGCHHTYSLLFTSEQGTARAVCM